MIKKENRLKKRKQFNYLFRNGNRVSNEYLSIVFLKLKTKNFKIGYSINKKVGKAVTRNKIKRRLKECVLKFSSNIFKDYYIIVSAKPEATTLSFNDLYTNLLCLFKKANLICE